MEIILKFYQISVVVSYITQFVITTVQSGWLLITFVKWNFIPAIHAGRTEVDNNRYVRNFFVVFLFTLRVFARNLLRGRNIFLFNFALRCLTSSLNCDLTSNKPTLYLLDYGNINRVFRFFRIFRLTQVKMLHYSSYKISYEGKWLS